MSVHGRCRTSTRRAALVLGCAIASSGLALPSGPPRASAARVDTIPGSSLRTTMVRRYTMSGHIRPLLFWIGRDDIGLARVVWRRGDEGARGYELLIGTDPARAPRSMNRWGYIAEEVLGPEDAAGSVLALMTRADETSYEEAATSVKGGAGRGEFRAIAARVADGTASWRVAAVQTPEPLTIHDLDAALHHVASRTTSAAHREMRVPRDARPGFLAALAELLDRAVQLTNRHGDAADLPHTQRRYLFGGQLYDLELRRAERAIEQVRNDSIPIVRATFDIHTPATGARTRFEIVCGTEGRLAGVPVSVAWQPRWWLKVSLKLID